MSIVIKDLLHWMSLHPLRTSLLLNLFAGLVITIGLIFYQIFRYWFNLRRHFHNVEFQIFWKYQPKKPYAKATCTVKGNRIKYLGERFPLNEPAKSWEGEFEGEFIMDEFSLRRGDGLHYHLKYDGFNLPKMFIRDNNTFYVETSYVRPTKASAGENEEAYEASVWRRITAKK